MFKFRGATDSSFGTLILFTLTSAPSSLEALMTKLIFVFTLLFSATRSFDGVEVESFSCLESSLYFMSYIRRRPKITSRESLNREPWRGLVKKSASISSIGQCFRVIVPLPMKSLTKQWRISTCLDLLPQDFLPLVNNLIVDMLSPCTTFLDNG